ncbi:hypothetical protein [Aerosakkonema funiforme]|uniref:hypothetical protein n=1 Tax=Aerosakkonema funiforme TaxID=1246630 RepID=UPI0035BB9BF5
MKLNFVTKRLSTVGQWMATALFCVSAIAFFWVGAFFANSPAMAAPLTNAIASADVGSQAQGKASEDAGRTKNFVRDAAEQVKETANKNASRVEQATGSDGNFIERKAKRDADRIEKRANEDSARTQEAIDNTKNAFESAIDGIKDAFGK